MRIGVIFAAWQAADLLDRSLTPWIEAKENRLDGHDFTICTVSAPFPDFPQDEEPDRTNEILGELLRADRLNHAGYWDTPIKETEARGAALELLALRNVDAVIQVDADEFYTQEQISRIFHFVESRPQIPWFRGCLKNLVFTPKQHLAAAFTPPRIHRLRYGSYMADSFWDDNNVLYRGTVTRDFKRDIDLASVTIPKSVAWVTHETWLSNSRSQKKVVYQRSRWKASSFRWDDKLGLQFDEEYFRLRGEPLPEVVAEA